MDVAFSSTNSPLIGSKNILYSSPTNKATLILSQNVYYYETTGFHQVLQCDCARAPLAFKCNLKIGYLPFLNSWAVTIVVFASSPFTTVNVVTHDWICSAKITTANSTNCFILCTGLLCGRRNKKRSD